MTYPTGPGWWPLCDAVIALAEAEGIESITFKEKFGHLRTEFWGGETDKLDALAAALESASGMICEECGCSGKPGGKAWIKTLCEGCRPRGEGCCSRRSNEK